MALTKQKVGQAVTDKNYHFSLQSPTYRHARACIRTHTREFASAHTHTHTHAHTHTNIRSRTEERNLILKFRTWKFYVVVWNSTLLI